MPDRSKKYSYNMPLRIKSLRVSFGLTQKQLAEKLQKGESTVRMWELGKSEPDSETVNLLSREFNISTDYILGNPFTLAFPITKWAPSQIEEYQKATDGEKEYLSFRYGHGYFENHSSENASSGTLSENELSVINAYRAQPQMQSAVHRLLGIEEIETIELWSAANSIENRAPQTTETTLKKWERIKNAPETKKDLL